MKYDNALVIIFVVLLCILGFLHFRNSDVGAPAEPDTSIKPGQQVYLTGGKEATAIGISYESLSRWETLLTANDSYGCKQLIAQGQIIVVPNGTKVLILNSNGLGCEVRILEGEYINRSGWTDLNWVVRTKK